jgi:glycine dehydrogenase subunit 1
MVETAGTVHPYIPNSIPDVKATMLAAIGAQTIDEIYADIPPHLRLNRLLDLPPAYTSEASLVRHMESILARNQTTRENLSFLGAGAYQHHVPAVCDEVNSRSEFLTAYSGEPYENHGRFQSLFEYASMMGDLLEMDVVNIPTYDGYQAAATSLRMACRVTGRDRVVITSTLADDKLQKIRDYLAPEIRLVIAPVSESSGEVDLKTLDQLVTDATAAVYLESPSYFGIISTLGPEIARIAHQVQALFVVSSDPISLGVIAPPAQYGADIACGDIQSLGMHVQYGGGHAGYIAVPDDPRLVMEMPSRLFGLAPTRVEGEYGFGDVAFERTSFARREQGKEWVGTAASLWGITAGVYLALLGPRGMAELGDGIMTRTRYAMRRLGDVNGLRVLHDESHHFREFVVDFGATGRTVAEVNSALLARGIFGGKDLSAEFPSLHQSALYCVTEIHSKADIDRLASELRVILQ